MKNITEQYLDYLQELPITAMGAMTGMSIAMMSLDAIKWYKMNLTKAAKACKNLQNEEKQLCMLDYKIDGKRKQIDTLKRHQAECEVHKNPSKCREQMQKKINKETLSLKQMFDNRRYLQQTRREKIQARAQAARG